jgi:para-nitrobenzyl esterase
MHSLNHPVFFALCLGAICSGPAWTADRVKTANGMVESTTQSAAGVRIFKGIPFAQPPVGDLRWREPQPVKNWKGVRKADQFGPRCMQRTGPGSDYWFRGNGMNEDCLYLNVWTPAKSAGERLPVLVYIFGGGFQNGDGSEPRYDGENMAGKGMVAVSVNYRLNIFGFFSHPELTKESPHHASGNYGLLDQAAALEWVERNIAAFGGDPKRVTIAGESAGSIAVSALMASPLTRGRIAGAIGESGGLIAPTTPPHPLAETEQDGVRFGTEAGAASLAALRALTAEQIQAALAKGQGQGRGQGRGLRFSVNLDGYFLARTLPEIFAAGEQAHVPLLAGTNSEEQGARSVLQEAEPTPEALAAAVKRLYGEQADGVLKAYAASTPEGVREAATHLASARFIAYSTWKWTELQMKTGGKPVYRYHYAHPRPRFLGNDATPALPGPPPSPDRGAAHSAEIQYAMGNIPIDPRYAWEPADRKVSETLQAYFVNFIKTGNPNGAGLPEWPVYSAGANYPLMRVDVDSHAMPEPHRDRYLALDAIYAKP